MSYLWYAKSYEEGRLMDKLSLIPLDDLFEEIEKRCTEMVCCYSPIDFAKGKELFFRFGGGDWHKACAMSNILNNDVLNNWNGELLTLQRINNEE